MPDDFGPVATTLSTDDGLSLEAQWAVPTQPKAKAVIAHPQYGGNMHSLVVSTLFAHLVGSGCAVLRFNLRGVGGSEGDQFNPPDQAQATIAGWTNAEIHPIGGADHFLVGRTDRLNELIDEFLVASSSNA